MAGSYSKTHPPPSPSMSHVGLEDEDEGGLLCSFAWSRVCCAQCAPCRLFCVRVVLLLGLCGLLFVLCLLYFAFYVPCVCVRARTPCLPDARVCKLHARTFQSVVWHMPHAACHMEGLCWASAATTPDSLFVHRKHAATWIFQHLQTTKCQAEKLIL